MCWEMVIHGRAIISGSGPVGPSLVFTFVLWDSGADVTHLALCFGGWEIPFLEVTGHSCVTHQVRALPPVFPWGYISPLRLGSGLSGRKVGPQPFSWGPFKETPWFAFI